ncbi:MAG: DUF1003 domain-containing protein [Rhodobacteraceae bacterium]|jgi:uncharacterized membrane protein|uniref:DUF1003 domain-containing protein n=1 Tax=Albidovulum sp. TaxID=1872424 RepID=UPI002657D42F|nr:DUF1003 domain-containing protein [uncultured Defluviimonas sp.]MCC0068895.1 DUF1003 domain-containing protein [Paracoccaceae bacterium]
MDDRVRELAMRLLSKGYDDLAPREQRVLRQIAARTAISRNINETFRGELSFGDRVADRVAAFGGSWSFIVLFGVVILGWVVANVWLLTRPADPYPFVFLNLVLSMVAALQAPVIMMSQNRQAAKDRIAAAHDYEVNLKAELEIMSLHEKVDDIRMRQLETLFARLEGKIDRLAGR